MPLVPTVTRREQSAGIVSGHAGALARRADSFVFGPSAPGAVAATTYWEQVDAERRAMSRQVGRRERLRAAISLRSLRRGPSRSDRAATLGADGPVGSSDGGTSPAPSGRGAGTRLRASCDWRSRRAPD